MRLLPFCAAALACAATAFAQSPDLTALLSKQLIDPGTGLAEVQAYCEGRVPLVPHPANLAEWETDAQKIRAEALEKVYFRGNLAQQWRDAKTKVEWHEELEGGPGYKLKKVRFEILPGFWTCGILYEPSEIRGKIPVHLAVNGHDGNGKAAPYKQLRCINLAKRGIASLNVDWIFMGQLRGPGYAHSKLNQLDLCGVSGLAPFYLNMSRGLDLLLALPYADPKRVLVSGLSGGGWQTITISALDPRVTLCNPVAGYSSLRTRARFPTDLGDSEQTPNDLATVCDYSHFTAMLAGRAALLTFNASDNCCFAAPHALAPLEEAARPIFALYGGQDRLRTHVNYYPGTHNFEVDNRQALYSMVGAIFFPGKKDFSDQEIPSEPEVKTAAQLNVPLPEDNLDLHKLAVAVAKDLPRKSSDSPDAAREKLAKLLNYERYATRAEKAGNAAKAGTNATYWKLRIADIWTVPAVELTRGAADQGTAIVFAEGGRAGALGEIENLLAAGKRVLAVDPYFLGENKITSRGYLYSLLVASTGARHAGLQANQLAAIARWTEKQWPGKPVELNANGPASTVPALAAAAFEQKAIATVKLNQPLESLHRAIDEDWGMDSHPEAFSFGLLESFDIPQLKSLVGEARVK
jgi:hypothetical protein